MNAEDLALRGRKRVGEAATRALAAYTLHRTRPATDVESPETRDLLDRAVARAVERIKLHRHHGLAADDIRGQLSMGQLLGLIDAGADLETLPAGVLTAALDEIAAGVELELAEVPS